MTLQPATWTPPDESEAILAELVERYVDRLQAGEPVDPREFVAEHPGHSEALLCLLPAARAMADLRRSTFGPGPGPIGGYRVVREVGRGGMGVVYEAEQVSTGRKVALKVLPVSSAADPVQLQRFRIEGQAAAALDHPHIVPVFEIGSERGVHFYAMRFVEGSSLAALIRGRISGSGPDHRESAALALQAAEGLAHAHDLGILHRDVKPANLLVDPTGHLWVADFGLARFPEGGDLTRTGDVIGTLRYLSPEQALGRRSVGPRADVYGLGATLYELATLRPAFDGQDRQELLRRIASEEPESPRKLDPTVPRDLQAIIGTAMAKEADDRYGSARELADDLRRFLDGRPVLARGPGPSKRLTRWVRRNRGAVAVALAVLALFLVGAGVAAGLLWREQVRTRENLRLALTALDEFCLSATGPELIRDPERVQAVQDLQLRALAIYERMLLQNPGDLDARRAAARAEHRVANILARGPRAAEAGPAYLAARRHLESLMAVDPVRLEYREEAADILGDWGASELVGRPGTADRRRQALGEHGRLALSFPWQAKYRRALARDCINVARTIGITKPAEAVEKEALFRRALELRRAVDDHSFDAGAEVAESMAYLGHLLKATRRPEESGEVMAEGRDRLAALDRLAQGDPARRHRVVELDGLFALPRHCDPSPDPDEALQVHRSALAAKAGLAAEFPFIPEFRAELAWGHHALANTIGSFGRDSEAEAVERQSVRMFDDLLSDHPTVDHYRRWAFLATESLARRLKADGRSREARDHFRRALELLSESSPARARIAGELASLDPPPPNPRP